MFFVCLLSFCAGYFLNEEKSLERLCKNLGYAHEGWLVLHHQRGYFFYIFFVLLSFIKSWSWGIVLKSTVLFWCFPAVAYIFGNIMAIFNLKRVCFSFTLWLSVAGMLLVFDKVLFQMPLTGVFICYLVTRKKSLSLKIWKISLSIATLIVAFWCHRILGLTIVLFSKAFWKKSSPLRIKLIQ